jgi:hypothetical protein
MTHFQQLLDVLFYRRPMKSSGRHPTKPRMTGLVHTNWEFAIYPRSNAYDTASYSVTRRFHMVHYTSLNITNTLNQPGLLGLEGTALYETNGMSCSSKAQITQKPSGKSKCIIVMIKFGWQINNFDRYLYNYCCIFHLKIRKEKINKEWTGEMNSNQVNK